MTEHPFKHLNAVHREAVDTPWHRPSRTHPIRDQWRTPPRRTIVHRERHALVRLGLRLQAPVVWSAILLSMALTGLVILRPLSPLVRGWLA